MWSWVGHAPLRPSLQVVERRHRGTWGTAANSPQPLTDDDFDRPVLLCVTFLEPTEVRTIDLSLLLVHICGTIYQIICGILN